MFLLAYAFDLIHNYVRVSVYNNSFKNFKPNINASYSAMLFVHSKQVYKNTISNFLWGDW